MSAYSCPHCGFDDGSFKHLKDHLRRCAVKQEHDAKPFREAAEARLQREHDIAYDLRSGGFTEQQSNTLARVLMEVVR